MLSYHVTDPPMHTHTKTHTNRQDRLQYTAPQLASAQCNKYIYSTLSKQSVCEVVVGTVLYLTVIYLFAATLRKLVYSSVRHCDYAGARCILQ